MTESPAAPAPQRICLVVNGVRHEISVQVRHTLADVLRRDLQLTGTHLGCEHGVCGACTVLVDGAPVRSCLMLAVQADGRTVETVEGLADTETGRRLQDAFVQFRSYQCGFCTPGFLMLSRWLIESGRAGDEASIRDGLSANLCRCTGYESIVDAVSFARG